MHKTERLINWLSATPGVIEDWSPSGHRNGQFVSETAYHVTNL
ncbi:MAG: hypothetical protein ACFFF9_03090 [Candidatus Thorarchaeota archaeon]